MNVSRRGNRGPTSGTSAGHISTLFIVLDLQLGYIIADQYESRCADEVCCCLRRRSCSPLNSGAVLPFKGAKTGSPIGRVLVPRVPSSPLDYWGVLKVQALFGTTTTLTLVLRIGALFVASPFLVLVGLRMARLRNDVRETVRPAP